MKPTETGGFERLGVGSGVDYKGVWEESDGTVLHLDCGVASTTECVCQKSWNDTLKGGILLCVNYTSIKLTGKTKQNKTCGFDTLLEEGLWGICCLMSWGSINVGSAARRILNGDRMERATSH